MNKTKVFFPKDTKNLIFSATYPQSNIASASLTETLTFCPTSLRLSFTNVLHFSRAAAREGGREGRREGARRKEKLTFVYSKGN